MRKFIILLTLASLLACSDDTDEVCPVYHQTYDVEDTFTWLDSSTSYDLNGDDINDVTVSTKFDALDSDFPAELTISPTSTLGNNLVFLVEREDNRVGRQDGEIISVKNTVFNYGLSYSTRLNKRYFDLDSNVSDTLYFAYKLDNLSGTYYGWMRLDFFQMKEFVTNLNPQADIIVGSTTCSL